MKRLIITGSYLFFGVFVLMGLWIAMDQAASAKLDHGKVAPNYESDGMKISERWWFA
jgi:hypothetical protein